MRKQPGYKLAAWQPGSQVSILTKEKAITWFCKAKKKTNETKIIFREDNTEILEGGLQLPFFSVMRLSR